MYQSHHIGGFAGRGLLPPAVKGLLLANGIMFILQEILGLHALWELLGLSPVLFWKGAIWQPVTYMFLHASFSHLLFNMLALWMFGSVLESVWGTKGLLKYYFLTGVGAALSNCILTPNANVTIGGASGAVFGLLAAYGMLFPNAVVYLSFLFPIKAKYLVLIFGVFEFFMSVNTIGGNNSTVAHIVHLGGMLIGIVYLKRTQILKWGAKSVKQHQRQKEHVRVERQNESDEQLRREVDDLLDKINEVGIGNLTTWERRRLRQASEKLKRKES